MKRLWVLTLIGLVVLFTAESALASPCSVKIDGFFLNSAGTAKGYYQYQITVTADRARAISATFHMAINNSGDYSVYAPEVDFTNNASKRLQSAMLLFVWPTSALSQISLGELTSLDGQTIESCKPAPVSIARLGRVGDATPTGLAQ